ncbi:MAG: CRISPR-associated endonuclease Cas2 [Candidatus Zambryskibacteria bacterium]|nr:CRISPR-associated endonuclease Cas2 [Candidatus Zambryskibacteria bacterium]
MRKGKIQKKILLLLLAGLSLSMSRSPKHHFRVIKDLQKEWREIDKKTLETTIASLYKSKLVDEKENKDGTITFILSHEGKHAALTYDLDNLTIARHLWDEKWRIIIFDIPEKKKSVREALRHHLKKLGFKKLQHSVFVLPFKCRSEIEYLIEFHNVRRFVRYIEANHIDNELDLKHKFGILQ